MIALLKQWTNQTWEGARHLLADDLTHLATAMNQRWAATFTDANILGLNAGGTGADLSATSGIAVRSAQNTFSNTAGQIIQGPLDLTAATAGQIKFPATQNPSSDVNTLDDYEEGTWTPASATVTITNNVTADYVKVGQLLCASFDISFPASASAAMVSITGLPFVKSGLGGFGSGSASLNSRGIYVCIIIGQGAAVMNFYDTALTEQTYTNFSTVRFAGILVYRTSA